MTKLIAFFQNTIEDNSKREYSVIVELKKNGECERKLLSDLNQKLTCEPETQSKSRTLTPIAPKLLTTLPMSAKTMTTTTQAFLIIPGQIVCLEKSKISNARHNSKVEDRVKRMHQCTYKDCKKSYLKASHLKAHYRVHTGEKPYKCQWSNCNKTFSRSDELTRHKRNHSGEKKFVCDICDKKFSRPDHLSKHTRTHLKKKLLVN